MRIICFIILAALLSGCAITKTPAHWGSISRRFNPSDGEGRLIDAKQRAIISVKRVVMGSQGLPNVGGDGKLVTDLAICAEPSPDALQATAYMLVGEVSDEAVLKTLFGESAASIGRRTQSIQLLRDAYYRLCEAYLNDGIDAIAYDVLQRRFQNQIIALLAVEQLTGAVKAVPTDIAVEAPRQDDAQAEEEGDKNETRPAGVNDKEKQLKTSKRLNGGDNYPIPPLTPDVVDAVRAITLNAINQDYEVQVCFETLRARNNVAQFKNDVDYVFSGGDSNAEFRVRRDDETTTFADHCDNLFDQQARLRFARAKIIEARANAVESLVERVSQSDKQISLQDVATLFIALAQAVPSEPGVAFLAPSFELGQPLAPVTQPSPRRQVPLQVHIPTPTAEERPGIYEGSQP